MVDAAGQAAIASGLQHLVCGYGLNKQNISRTIA